MEPRLLQNSWDPDRESWQKKEPGHHWHAFNFMCSQIEGFYLTTTVLGKICSKEKQGEGQYAYIACHTSGQRALFTKGSRHGGNSYLCPPIKSGGRTKSRGARLVLGRGSSSPIYLFATPQLRDFHHIAGVPSKIQEECSLAQGISNVNIMTTQQRMGIKGRSML